MMREIDPAGTLDRARTQLQVTAARGSEMIVPRLRGRFARGGVRPGGRRGRGGRRCWRRPAGRPWRRRSTARRWPRLFGGSALYHRWPGPARFKPLLQRIDHSTIFVFIAASYTPIAVMVLHGVLVYVVLAIAWVGAARGRGALAGVDPRAPGRACRPAI